MAPFVQPIAQRAGNSGREYTSQQRPANRPALKNDSQDRNPPENAPEKSKYLLTY
jgi:hypothetical protein